MCGKKLRPKKRAVYRKWRSLIEVLEVSDLDLVDLKINICPGYPPKIITLEQQEAYAILC